MVLTAAAREAHEVDVGVERLSCFLVRLTLLTTPAQTEGMGSGGWLQEADVRQIQIYRDDNVNNQNNQKGNGGY